MKSNTEIVNAYTDQLGPGKHILYFGDPMCSWCWGFSPVIRKIITAAKNTATFNIITTGLRPNVEHPWDENLRATIRHHWQSVTEKTGQPFDFTRFEDVSFVYNTEPACRAVVTVRNLKPDATFAMFETVQRAFYGEGQDITNSECLTTLSGSCGVDQDQFSQLFAEKNTFGQTLKDFQLTRIFAVQGFPTVLLINDAGIQTLTPGYQPWDSLRSRIEEWLNA